MKETKQKEKKCGIIMPISAHDDYPKEHWSDVLNILTEAIEETEFEPRLVSDDVAIGLIHDRIVTNIYNDEIIVCDVSSKNPNVMFELGLRLAFDKPTIIVKDELTGYSFDTGVIEHIEYPSSLRFNQIVEFKKELIKRIKATYKKSKEEKGYSPFLKSFGKKIIPASIEQTEIPEGKFILDQLSILRKEVRNLANFNDYNSKPRFSTKNNFSTKLYNHRDNLLDKYLREKLINANNILTDKDIEEIRKEMLKKGVEISSEELKEYLESYNKWITVNR